MVSPVPASRTAKRLFIVTASSGTSAGGTACARRSSDRNRSRYGAYVSQELRARSISSLSRSPSRAEMTFVQSNMIDSFHSLSPGPRGAPARGPRADKRRACLKVEVAGRFRLVEDSLDLEPADA